MALKRSGFKFPAKRRSLFEKNGDHLMETLETLQKDGKRHVHWYQLDAVRNTKKFLEEDWRELIIYPTLIVAPTGAGKTGIITLLPYALKAKKVLILTPGLVISKQIEAAFGGSKRLESFFEKCGLVESGDRGHLEGLVEPPKIIEKPIDIVEAIHTGNLVIVNAQKFGGRSYTSLTQGQNTQSGDSPQSSGKSKSRKKPKMEDEPRVTLVRHTEHNHDCVIDDVRKFFSQFDLLIVDEAHHYPAYTWLRIKEVFTESQSVSHMDKKSIIFLTATPHRQVQGELVSILDKQRIAYSIEMKDCLGVSTRAYTFEEDELVKDEDECQQIYRHMTRILEEHDNKEKRFQHQALMSVRTIKRAEELMNGLNFIHANLHDDDDEDHDPDFISFAVAINGSNKSNNKTDLLRQFNDGKFRVAIICRQLAEGYDNPKVSLCFIHQRFRSRVPFQQFVGRCIRQFVPSSSKNGKDQRYNTLDKTDATVFSFTSFEQRRLFEQLDKLAEEDPIDTEV